MLSLRQKLGQMLIMGFPGCDIGPESAVVSWIKKDGLGGVLLFDKDLSTGCDGKNIRNREQVIRLTRQLQDLSDRSGDDEQRLPLFVSIDYEGGAVDRLGQMDGSIKTISAHEQALLSHEALISEYETMASELQHLGFNLNFAPVVDLNLNDKQGIIGQRGRSFSKDSSEVIRMSKAFVSTFARYGIACAYKHFPGHGSAVGDTHLGFVDVTDSYDPNELLPYQTLLKDETLPQTLVMTAHVINRQLDASGLPATLSHPILTDLLRHAMGFEGLIISDDLQMQAISEHYSLEDALRLTINAGADLMIFANQLDFIEASVVVDCMERLVNTGAIELRLIEQAYQRISYFKQKQVIIPDAIIQLMGRDIN
ncbi:MAG: glycoside hydrolase family 3 protein [Legionellales bacterium]|nr:glycoside hydrolase family 3 protein [Legionellales bacterium]